MLRSLLFGLMAVASACAVSSQADAYFPGCFGPRVGYSGFGITNFGGYGGFGYGGDWGNIPAPPYYAIHPPVYYSYPVARPYGVSPFAISAYQPSQRVVYQTPTPEPQVVVNPYVSTEVPVAEPAGVAPAELPSDEGAGEEALTEEPAAEEAAPAANETTASPWPTPLVVINPFVDSNEVVPVSFTKITTP